MTIFATCLGKFTFIDRQSFVLVGENFHGLSFYFNFKIYHVKISSLLQCRKLESIISEKTHLLQNRYWKNENSISNEGIQEMNTRDFMEGKDFHKMDFFRCYT